MTIFWYFFGMVVTPKKIPQYNQIYTRYIRYIQNGSRPAAAWPPTGILYISCISCIYLYIFGYILVFFLAPFLLLHSRGGHPYRPAYLPNFDKRSLTISKCMSIGAHCIPHCKIMVGKERPAALNQTVMHIGCNRS